MFLVFWRYLLADLAPPEQQALNQVTLPQGAGPVMVDPSVAGDVSNSLGKSTNDKTSSANVSLFRRFPANFDASNVEDDERTCFATLSLHSLRKRLPKFSKRALPRCTSNRQAMT